MENILVVGKNGHIGNYLFTHLNKKNRNIIGTSRKENGTDILPLELADSEKFPYDYLKNISTVIFTAGDLNAERCEKNKAEVWAGNVTGTIYFIEKALSYGCKVIFLSSDTVYGNTGNCMVNEDMLPAPVSAYGFMKKTVEDRFLQDKNFKTLRLSYVFSLEDKFMKYCFKCHDIGDKVEIYHPYYRNFIMIHEVQTVIEALITDWYKYSFSILNVCGEEQISKIRILDEFNRFSGQNIKYKVVIPPEEYFKNRPPVIEVRSKYLFNSGILQRKFFSDRFLIEMHESKRGDL